MKYKYLVTFPSGNTETVTASDVRSDTGMVSFWNVELPTKVTPKDFIVAYSLANIRSVWLLEEENESTT